jgi:hypothetical protein
MAPRQLPPVGRLAVVLYALLPILDALARVIGGFRDDFLAALAAVARTRARSGVLGTTLLVVGAILALVTWVYLSSLILFAGGEFTAVFARQYGSRTGSRGPGHHDPP